MIACDGTRNHFKFYGGNSDTVGGKNFYFEMFSNLIFSNLI